MSKLSRDGYVIRKKNFTTDEIKEFKDELTMEPFSMNDFGEKNKKTFNLFLSAGVHTYLHMCGGMCGGSNLINLCLVFCFVFFLIVLGSTCCCSVVHLYICNFLMYDLLELVC